MRKFRHKPSGEIFTQKNDLEMIGLKDSESDGFTLPTWLLEQGNDWEEVKEDVAQEPYVRKLYTPKEEPNYLITAFRFKDYQNIWNIKSNGLYGAGVLSGRYSTREMLYGESSVEDGKVEIYSVKNSEGEEFTIGDSVMYEKEKFTISNFNIGYTDINIMMAVFNETNTKLNNLNGSNIELLSKVKSPIYTTTDGVDIKEGSCLVLYLVNKELNTLYTVEINSFSKEDAKIASRYLTFTSEENRDKYIKKNTRKPIFVSADGKEIFEGDEYYYIHKHSFHMDKAKCHEPFIKSDLQSGNGVYFHSKELAQEYIDNNKPKYSLADFRNIIKEMGFRSDSGIYGRIAEELKKLGK